MQRALTLLAAGLLLTACSGGSTSETSSSATSAIIGGSIDAADPAIVEFFESVGNDGSTCTATFISPTVLLTAAHCIVDFHSPKVIPPNATYKIMVAASEGSAKATDFIAVPTSNVHPNPLYDGNGGNDVGIIVLDQPVNVTPVPINRTALTQADVGKRVRIVGYGQSKTVSGPNDGADTKRAVGTAIMSLTGTYVGVGSAGGQACDGDSGGPVLLSIDGVETIIGTDDVGATSVHCGGGDFYQRTDLFLDFIDQFLNPSATDPTPDPSQAPSAATPAAAPAPATDPCTDPNNPASSDPTQCPASSDPCQDPNNPASSDPSQCPPDGVQNG